MSRENSLVTAQWVEDHLDDPQIVLVEVDEDTTSYDKGHIRGAIKLDWTTDLQDQVRRDFVSKSQFEALLSSRGVGNDHTVVLYGGNNNWFAAYAYWYFKLYGHQDVKLLDGGRKKWELDSRELTDQLPTREQTSYTAQEQDTSIRAFRDETVEAIGVKNLVDVRSPDEYAGRLLAPAHLPQEQAQRAGHIPTAASVPWSTFFPRCSRNEWSRPSRSGSVKSMAMPVAPAAASTSIAATRRSSARAPREAAACRLCQCFRAEATRAPRSTAPRCWCRRRAGSRDVSKAARHYRGAG